MLIVPKKIVVVKNPLHKKIMRGPNPPKKTATVPSSKQTATAIVRMPNVMTAGQTREMNSEEKKIWQTILKKLSEERKEVKAALNRGRICRSLQSRLSIMGYLDPEIWTGRDTADMEALARVANDIERVYLGLETQKLFVRKKVNDFEIISTQKEPVYYSTLGNPIVYIAVGAVVIVVGAFLVSIAKMITTAANKKTDYGNRLLKADQWAAKQPAKVKAAYKSFRDSKENAPFWPEATGAFKQVAFYGIGLFVLYAIYKALSRA